MAGIVNYFLVVGNEDEFLLAAAGYLGGTSASGSINGIDAYYFSLNISDTASPATIFSSVALPGNSSFASSATFIAFQIIDFSYTKQINDQLSPGSFTFTSTPEPGSFV